MPFLHTSWDSGPITYHSVCTVKPQHFQELREISEEEAAEIRRLQMEAKKLEDLCDVIEKRSEIPQDVHVYPIPE